MLPFLLALLLGCPSSGSQSNSCDWSQASAALLNVTVIDIDGTRGPHHLALQGDTILCETLRPPPDSIEVIGARGVVVPGLIDPHVHLSLSPTRDWAGDSLPATLRTTLAFGITTVVDAGGPAETLALRKRIEAGWLLGPHVLALGPFVTAPMGHPCETQWDPSRCQLVSDEAAASALGEQRVAQGYDGIKVALSEASFTPWSNPRLDPTLAAAAIAPVRAAGGLAYAHISSSSEVIDAIEAGATTLAHPPFDGPISSDAIDRIVSEGVIVHTTLSAFKGPRALMDGTLPSEGVPDAVLESWATTASDDTWFTSVWVPASEQWTRDARANLATLRSAGATLLPASDGGYAFVPHGVSFHDELDELANLGFSNEQVLGLATAGAADALGLSDRGRIAPGQRADFLLLDANPTSDLAALRAPRAVFLAGVPYDRDNLLRLDPWLQGEPGGDGAFCLDARDCSADLACNRVNHRCAQACEAGDSCGPNAWCARVDQHHAQARVCQQVEVCEPGATCMPEGYGMYCQLIDNDTATCMP